MEELFILQVQPQCGTLHIKANFAFCFDDKINKAQM